MPREVETETRFATTTTSAALWGEIPPLPPASTQALRRRTAYQRVGCVPMRICGQPRLAPRSTTMSVAVPGQSVQMTTFSRNDLGAFGEQVAVEHLCGLGLRILERNWRCRYGELDVIAADTDGTLVFIEVKTRTGDGFGGVEYAVTPQKVRRLRRLAGLWLAGQDSGWRHVRIDVVGVRIGRRHDPEVLHLRGVG